MEDRDAAETPSEASNAGRVNVRPVHFALAVFFLVVWLIPISVVGVTGKPFGPGPGLSWLHNVACLFDKRQPVWLFYHLEYRTEASEEWISLPFEPYAPMEPFGHTSRLDRRIRQIYSYRGKRRNPPALWERARAQEREMAEWVRQRHAALYPDEPPVTEVRFLRIAYDIYADLADPQGHWKKEGFRSNSDGTRRYYGTVKLEDRGELLE